MLQEQLNRDFERVRGQLKSFIFRITASVPDTEDIVQDTYLKALEKLDTFKGASSLKTWFFTIASNLTREDLARAESMRHPDIHIPAFLEINQTSPHGKFELREHINLCFTCIGKTLPIEQQLAVLLKELFDFKIAEIATILGKTEGVVKHTLLNARKSMQEIFEMRCSLINKQGACHQCSELNGIFNPKQDFQAEQLKAGLENAMNDSSKEYLFDLRARISKAVDPYQCDGSDLHFFHFDHINKVLDAET
jgi:RNA polymerase sigma-70 factor (ECF subfamily)